MRWAVASPDRPAPRSPAPGRGEEARAGRSGDAAAHRTGGSGRPARSGADDWRDRRPTEDRRGPARTDRTPPAPAGPALPDWADPRDLDPTIRASLRGLDSRNADTVARHLVVAGTLVDEEPEEALAHARAARDRASRIAVVREAVGVAAYHAGDYTEAAKELRAYRRMSGDEGYRAVLADCERALGRPEVALRLVREALDENPDRAETVELHLVEAGARQDLGEAPAARLLLEGAMGGRPQPDRVDLADQGTRRLASAYADLLTVTGDPTADAWQDAVAAATPEEDIAFGEEDLPAPAGDEEMPEAGGTDGVPVTDGVSVTDDPAAGDPAAGDLGEGAPAIDGPGDDGPGDDGPGDDVDVDADVEREVAELLGEVEPPEEDRPAH